MPIRPLLAAAVVSMLFVGSVLAQPPPWAQTHMRVGATVAGEFERHARVRVFVLFAVDSAFSDPVPPSASDSARERAAIRGTLRALLARADARHIEVVREFETVAGFAAFVTEPGLDLLLSDPRVLRIDLDEGGRGLLLEAKAASGVTAVQATGLGGLGIEVAVLDTGIHSPHPDLGSSLVAEACFCSGGDGCCPNGTPTQTGFGAAIDDHGHGSNVIGTITSDGFVSPAGVAPSASIVAVKVMDYDNEFCCASDVIAGLDWVAVNRPEADLVNLSLGTAALFAGACDDATSYTMAFSQAIGALRAQGVLTIASSGNNGSGTMMSAPACNTQAFSVAAAYDADVGLVSTFGCFDSSTQVDQVACYSNTNAETDIIASANPITSAGLSSNTSTLIGTSVAAPVVTGCAALLLEALPIMTPERLESALRTSGVQVTDSTNGLSFPRLDCAAALAVVPVLTPGLGVVASVLAAASLALTVLWRYRVS